MNVNALNNLIKEKINKREDEWYKNLYGMTLDMVREFIIKNKLIIYGGFALNELLPKKYRFYNENEIPDFDVYVRNDAEKERHLYDNPGNIITTKVKKLMMNLKKKVKQSQNKMRKTLGLHMQLKLSSMLSSLKETTIKISMNEIDLLDLSIMGKEQFDRYMYIYKMHKKEIERNLSGDFIVNPVALKMALYYELGKLDSANRWTKLYKRMGLVDKYFYNNAFLNPNKYPYLTKKIDLKYNKMKLLSDLRKFIINKCKNRLVIIGGQYNFLVKNKNKLHKIFNIENYKSTTLLQNYDIPLEIHILNDVEARQSIQISKDKVDLMNELNKYLKKIKSEYALYTREKNRNLFLPTHTEVFIRKEDEMHLLFTFRYLDDGCYSFNTINDVKYLNYFTSMQWFYLHLMNNYKDKKMREYYYKLIYHMDKKINSFKNIKDLFIIKCIGPMPVPVQVEEDL